MILVRPFNPYFLQPLMSILLSLILCGTWGCSASQQKNSTSSTLQKNEVSPQSKATLTEYTRRVKLLFERNLKRPKPRKQNESIGDKNQKRKKQSVHVHIYLDENQQIKGDLLISQVTDDLRFNRAVLDTLRLFKASGPKKFPRPPFLLKNEVIKKGLIFKVFKD